MSTKWCFLAPFYLFYWASVVRFMIFFLKWLSVLTIIFCSSSIVYAQNGLSEYKVGSGDTIRIAVFGEDDLSIESQLSDAGSLSYPFLGELKLIGLTVGQVEEMITKGLLGDYLIDPRVSVTITEYRQFYVNGEVGKPGGFPFQPGLTVRKAISLAEGFTERASKKNIFIISEGDSESDTRRVQLNSVVKPGDIITVEQSFF